MTIAEYEKVQIAGHTDPEDLLGALPDHLKEVLASLEGQPADVVALALSTLRYGSRTTLAEANVIQGVPAEAETGTQVTLTDYGREVIAACARDYAPDLAEKRSAEEELDTAREDWNRGNPRRA